MKNWYPVILVSITIVMFSVIYVQWIWVRTAYELERKEVNVSFYTFLNARQDELIHQLIKQKEQRPPSKQVTYDYLQKEEATYKKFLDSLLLQTNIGVVPYEFSISTTSALSGEMNIPLIKSLHFDTRLKEQQSTLIEKILFANHTKDIFEYQEGGRQVYTIQLLYHTPVFWLLNRIKSIVLGSMSMILLAIITFVIYWVSLVRQKHFDKVKNDFFNGMTHELNTPIAVIQLATQYLAQVKKRKDPLIVETSEVILHETQRMSNIVRNVLASAKLQKDQFLLNKEIVNVVEVFKEAIDVYHFHLKKIDYKVTEKYINDPHIIGDSFHLMHVFSNLVDNSIKYRNKSRPLELDIKIYDDYEHCIVEFKDNGVGMNEEEIKRIFNPFFRVGSTKDVAKGFGLGLSYVKDVIQLHNGSIEIDSKIGEGTFFKIVFRLDK